MRNRDNILLALVVLAGSLSAQQVPNPSSEGGGKVMGERDRLKEDQIAKLFESIRSNLNSPKLTRIGHRDNLEQEVCTMALTGTLPKRPLTDTLAFYKTLQPETISPELNHVASFNALHVKNKAGYRRFSVAVWRNRDSQSKEAVYWVGVEL